MGNNPSVYPMTGIHNRLDYVEVIAHLLTDVQTSVVGINTHELKLDLMKAKSRFEHEGSSFFTKALPNLGKALDCALQGTRPFDSGRWRKLPNTQLPKFLGELFKRVFSPTGELLAEPSIKCIQVLRDLLFVFYKYELPHTQTQSNKVIDTFVANEEAIAAFNRSLRCAAGGVSLGHRNCALRAVPVDCRTLCSHEGDSRYRSTLIDAMRKETHRLLCSLQLADIQPKHGPGVVSTRECGSEKYSFKRISSDLERFYPYTEYFVPNVADDIVSVQSLDKLDTSKPKAQVLLVPKDSRGPRLISCEPLENQWIQQGIKDLMVKYIESHREMGGHVNFTDQNINRNLALQGSVDGSYCTLDLRDASDRVSLELVKTLFPTHLLGPILACRTNTTRLPDGREVSMAKFAPMGSALCFPILAFVVWTALTAPGANACSRETTYVYGDDIIVQRTDVQNAIKRLTAIHLAVNEGKSCVNGLFRESCGMDAYSGVSVTPFRLRKVWHRQPSPETIVSYLAKANQAYNRGYQRLANYLAALVAEELRFIPYSLDEGVSADVLSGTPHLHFLPTPIAPNSDVPPYGVISLDGNDWRCSRLRTKMDHKLQRLKVQTLFLKPKTYTALNDRNNYFRALHNGAMKDRYGKPCGISSRSNTNILSFLAEIRDVTSSSVYTHRRASMLVRKWR